MAFPYETPITFIDDVGQFHGAEDLDALSRNAQQLDAASFRFMPTFDYHDREPGVTYQASVNTKGDKRFWWGAGQVPVGATTLTITGRLQKYSTESLQFFVNESVSPAATVSTNGSFTVNLTLSSLSLAAGDIVRLEARKVGNTAGWGTYDIDAAYCSPISIAASWPGLTAFAGTYNASRLNQLGNACAWLLQRIAAVPMPAQVGQVFRPASYKPHASVANEPWVGFPIYSGSVLKTHANDILRVGFQLQNFLNAEEHFEVYVSGSLASTNGPYAAGATPNLYIPISLSGLSVGQRAPVHIRQRVVTGNELDFPAGHVPTRLTLTACRAEASGAGYGYATPPTDYTPRELLSSTNHDTRLNAIRSILQGAYDRIAAVPEVWNRAYLMRRRYAVDTTENNKGKIQSWYPHRVDARRGDRLVVRGRGIKLCWGPITATPDEEGVPTYNETTYAHEEAILEDGSETTKTIFLDSYPALPPGTAYYLKGADLIYAAEHLV